MAFSFSAFCYMLALLLCSTLIFFAIWHIAAFDELQRECTSPLEHSNVLNKQERMRKIERICRMLRQVPTWTGDELSWTVRPLCCFGRRRVGLLSQGGLVQARILPALLFLLPLQHGLQPDESSLGTPALPWLWLLRRAPTSLPKRRCLSSADRCVLVATGTCDWEQMDDYSQ
ncbi:uncharacterized protein LOC133342310 isoform X2 [Lethenteron reissneri]|uniref:uncharacterized protein LOC133342310 isoform X2 n=1 Tax=Lethenteron reissneri TaxID=7753 RepID=UPI002AB6CFEA|nr:uncharacterized protein LOC133342310 isoform X2 [Lethenteron reissneri]